jgi:hypothetical protein
MEIKTNSGPPIHFQRLGYYEAFNWERESLHLGAAQANTDGSYIYTHWAFARIDPSTWDPVIDEPGKQWADFKALLLKRILAFGGWACSTEPATFNIIRSAILDNPEAFATKIA